jgi:lysine 2,3-aminomutase
VYQHDLTRSVEDLRTPLKVILELDKRLRGTLSGFMMPAFVVDLPGGGGKRLASTYDSYDEATGVSVWSAPGLPGAKGERKYTYFDPSPLPATAEELQLLRTQQDLMHKHKSTQAKDFLRDHEEDDAAGQTDSRVPTTTSGRAPAVEMKAESTHTSGPPNTILSATFTPTAHPRGTISLQVAPASIRPSD